MRIGIVTEELSLYPPCGGIATANEGLAAGLRLAGHDVEILYLPKREIPDRHSEEERAIGARVVELEVSGNRVLPFSSRSYAAYLQLQDCQFDVIFWPDFQGIGYYSMLAKSNGKAFSETQHVLLSYGPLAWCRECSGELGFRPAIAEVDYLERECYRLADRVVFNSAYLWQWCQRNDYQLAPSVVIPSLVPAHFREGALKTAADFPRAGQVQPIKELAFFGRLESRKGFEIFVEAIQLLSQQKDLSGLNVFFFGRPIKNNGLHAYLHIINQLNGLPLKLYLIDDANTSDFLEFCEGRPVLAVLPSINDNLPGTVIECVNHEIPVIASNSGGIPEIIDAKDHEVLCDPIAAQLSDCIESALNQGQKIAHPARLPSEILKQWNDFLEILQLECSSNCAVADAEPPKPCPDVTVGLVHYNRPKLLQRSLLSILQQTLKPSHIIIVDDNSPNQEELKKTLEPFYDIANEHGIRLELIINPQNIYLGACRNIILSQTTTQYVIFIDDDDVAMPEMLASLHRLAQANHADVAVPHLFYLPEENDQVTPYAQVIASPRPPQWFFRGPDVHGGLFSNIFGPAPSLFSTAALREIDGYTDLHGVGFEDYELIFKLALLNKTFAVHAEPLLAYRINPDSMLRTTCQMSNYGRVFKMLKQFHSQALRKIDSSRLLEFLLANEHAKSPTSNPPWLGRNVTGISPDLPIEEVNMQIRSLIQSGTLNVSMGKESLQSISSIRSEWEADELLLLSSIDWSLEANAQQISQLPQHWRSLIHLKTLLQRGDKSQAKQFVRERHRSLSPLMRLASDYALGSRTSDQQIARLNPADRSIVASLIQVIQGVSLSSRQGHPTKLDLINTPDLGLAFVARWDGLPHSLLRHSHEKFTVGAKSHNCIRFTDYGLLVHPNSDHEFVSAHLDVPQIDSKSLVALLFKHTTKSSSPVEVHCGGVVGGKPVLRPLGNVAPEATEQLVHLPVEARESEDGIIVATKMPTGQKPVGARIAVTGFVFQSKGIQ